MYNRIKRNAGIALLFVLLFSFGAQAQQVTSMRINEVLVINEDNFVDDYGKRNGWIELYNTSAGTVNIGGCFLTNDKNNPTKYTIPKGDVLTKIPPRQHTLFWADGNADHGTFHVNFQFDPAKENYIALYDADGRTLVDEIVIPATQKADISYGRLIDGKEEWGTLKKVTPSTNNLTLDRNEKIDNLKENDPSGLGMTMTAMAVVFSGLVLLYLVFKQVGKSAVSAGQRRAKKASADPAIPTTEAGEISAETLAAIGMALYELDQDVHDFENTVLTIHKVKRTYSPWSSKIYGLRELPRK
ncbi:OadG family transporter subunit [Parabacteroides sp. PF5-6]|uniref:OadG family transporter subunit n=1 Tax=Parabacteroides sp. PF5-6 TaxID=1742403 RepID=UPI00240577C5|nr:OadG family transporter subunit [Parabacteroides sp. PF5-6]MDF9830455.1 Na+-transporting methylmalonyl-CoA/oxaloacetate decarboxylase gamma subunit [Parabacteroides sp. PF5-6]